MYHGISVRLYHTFNTQRMGQMQEILQELRHSGADAVAIIPHQYCLTENTNWHGLAELPVGGGLATHPGQYVFADRDEGSTRGIGLVGNTTPVEQVQAICSLAKSLGFQVMLKPHVDPLEQDTSKPPGQYRNAGWRGYASWRNGDGSFKPNWDAFFQSYCNDFLHPYVEIAKDLHLPLFSLGVEYYTLTRDDHEMRQGQPGRTPFWAGVADWVRGQSYTGGLTYAANWGWGDDAEFQRLAVDGLWQHPAIGYIGVDAYYPLWPVQLPAESWLRDDNGQLHQPLTVSDKWEPTWNSALAAPSVAQLVQGWRQSHLKADGIPIDPVSPYTALTTLSATTGKPLLFTEIGYSNRLGAAYNPGRDPILPDPNDPNAPCDHLETPPSAPDGLQARLVRAFQQVWGADPHFGGYFWWDAEVDPASAITHNIIGQPAAGLLFTGGAPPADDFALLHAPRITGDRFRQVLLDAGSTALFDALSNFNAGLADGYYAQCVQREVDPAIALAFFALESTYGTNGTLVQSHNWGMLWSGAGPRTYPSWAVGLDDWLTHITGPTYTQHGPPTLDSVVPIYKQGSGVDPAAYIQQAKALIRSWGG